MSSDTLKGSRRTFLAAAGGALAAASLTAPTAQAQAPAGNAGLAPVSASDHWTVKQVGSDNVKLYLRRKRLASAGPGLVRGTILFVHGSSVSATPVFDLQIPGKPASSTMDWFARAGFDTWCVD
jgi:hypothetical protein